MPILVKIHLAVRFFHAQSLAALDGAAGGTKPVRPLTPGIHTCASIRFLRTLMGKHHLIAIFYSALPLNSQNSSPKTWSAFNPGAIESDISSVDSLLSSYSITITTPQSETTLASNTAGTSQTPVETSPPVSSSYTPPKTNPAPSSTKISLAGAMHSSSTHQQGALGLIVRIIVHGSM